MIPASTMRARYRDTVSDNSRVLSSTSRGSRTLSHTPLVCHKSTAASVAQRTNPVMTKRPMRPGDTRPPFDLVTTRKTPKSPSTAFSRPVKRGAERGAPSRPPASTGAGNGMWVWVEDGPAEGSVGEKRSQSESLREAPAGGPRSRLPTRTGGPRSQTSPRPEPRAVIRSRTTAAFTHSPRVHATRNGGGTGPQRNPSMSAHPTAAVRSDPISRAPAAQRRSQSATSRMDKDEKQIIERLLHCHERSKEGDSRLATERDVLLSLLLEKHGFDSNASVAYSSDDGSTGRARGAAASRDGASGSVEHARTVAFAGVLPAYDHASGASGSHPPPVAAGGGIGTHSMPMPTQAASPHAHPVWAPGTMSPDGCVMFPPNGVMDGAAGRAANNSMDAYAAAHAHAHAHAHMHPGGMLPPGAYPGHPQPVPYPRGHPPPGMMPPDGGPPAGPANASRPNHAHLRSNSSEQTFRRTSPKAAADGSHGSFGTLVESMNVNTPVTAHIRNLSKSSVRKDHDGPATRGPGGGTAAASGSEMTSTAAAPRRPAGASERTGGSSVGAAASGSGAESAGPGRARTVDAKAAARQEKAAAAAQAVATAEGEPDDAILEKNRENAAKTKQRKEKLAKLQPDDITDLIFERYDVDNDRTLGQWEYKLLMSHIMHDVDDSDTFLYAVNKSRFELTMTEERANVLRRLLLAPPISSLLVLGGLTKPGLKRYNGKRARVRAVLRDGSVEVAVLGGAMVSVDPENLVWDSRL